MTIWLLVILPLWGTVAARVGVAISQPRSRPLYFSFLSLAIALTAIRPETAAWVVESTGSANLPDLIKHITGMIAVYSILTWVVAVTPQTSDTPKLYQRLARGNTRHTVTAIAVASSLACFPFLANPERLADIADGPSDVALANIPHVPDQILAQIDHPLGALALQIFQGYLAFGMTCCALMCWDAWRRDRKTLLGIGMGVVSAGCAFGVAYAVLRLGYLALALAGWILPTWILYAGTNVFVILSVLCIVIGTSLPMVLRLYHMASYRRSLRKLRPLWEVATAAVPAIVLGARPSRTHDRFSLVNLYMRRHRRIVEIQDGVMALQPWSSSDLAQAVLECARGNDVIFAQALLIKVAAQRKIWWEQNQESKDAPMRVDLTEPLLPSTVHSNVRASYLQQLSWALEPHPQLPVEDQLATILPGLDQQYIERINRSLSCPGLKEKV